MKRADSFLNELKNGEGKIAIFTHGGVIRSVLALLIGYENARYFNLANTGITKLNVSADKTLIDYVNDSSHLA